MGAARLRRPRPGHRPAPLRHQDGARWETGGAARARQPFALGSPGRAGAVELDRSDLLEAWFQHAQPDLSPKTERETRGYIDRNLVPSLGALRLDRLRATASTPTTDSCGRVVEGMVVHCRRARSADPRHVAARFAAG